MNLLQDFLSREATRIWAASCEVASSRDAAQLDELAAQSGAIARATSGVELGGALFPNAEHLRFALEKLEFWRDRRGCLCRLYPEYLFFDPHQEQKSGHVSIASETVNREQWTTSYHCECALCQTRYAVEEAESHYTWWQWQILV